VHQQGKLTSAVAAIITTVHRRQHGERRIISADDGERYGACEGDGVIGLRARPPTVRPAISLCRPDTTGGKCHQQRDNSVHCGYLLKITGRLLPPWVGLLIKRQRLLTSQ